MKRYQETTDINKIKGNAAAVSCSANKLEALSMAKIFEQIKSKKPAQIGLDGDVKLVKLLENIDWVGEPPKAVLDLSHLLKNLKVGVFEKNFKKAGINGSKCGVGNHNKLFIIKHVKSTFRFFARELSLEKRNLKMWKCLINNMFIHLSGKKTQNSIKENIARYFHVQ